MEVTKTAVLMLLQHGPITDKCGYAELLAMHEKLCQILYINFLVSCLDVNTYWLG